MVDTLENAILEVTQAEASGVLNVASRTLGNMLNECELTGVPVRIRRDGGRVNVDLNRLIEYFREKNPEKYDYHSYSDRLAELRQQRSTIHNDHGPAAVVAAGAVVAGPEPVKGGVVEPIRGEPTVTRIEGAADSAALAVPEQAVMASIAVSLREDLRAGRVELEKAKCETDRVKKTVWAVAGVLVAVMIGAVMMGWLWTVTSGKLETAEAVTGEKVVQITSLNGQIGGMGGQIEGLTGQLESAAKREGQKQAQIDKLQKQVTGSMAVKDDLADRLASAHATQLVTEQEAGKLRVELEKIRQDRKMMVGLKVGDAGDR